MRAIVVATAVALGLAVIGPPHAAADVVFVDPSVHCVPGAHATPTHGPTFCAPATCTTDAECNVQWMPELHGSECRQGSLCVVEVPVTNRRTQPPTLSTRQEVRGACSATTPCAEGVCTPGSYCFPAPPQAPDAGAPTAPPTPVLPLPPVAPPPSEPLATAAAAGWCGGVLGSFAVLAVVALVRRMRGR